MTKTAPTGSLKLDGDFYPRFIEDSYYSSEALTAIKSTVENLLAQPTTAHRPGMLLGKVQSGKTKTFMGIMALAFDNGFGVCVVLTKGTKALTKQTYERLEKEFATFSAEDLVQAYDIMTMPSGLTAYELNQKLIFVVKKQADNLNRLSKAFFETYPVLGKKKMLIIDDEADYASIGFKNTKEEGVLINKIAGQIDHLRKDLADSSFLQVTATPYSLYLQPENLEIPATQQAFKPIRPAFTELVPVHGQYIGGDYYFYESQEQGSIASFLHEPVTRDELEVFKKEDRRSFKIEDCLTSQKIKSVRDAIVNFVVGGCIRRLQNAHEGKPKSKFSFIIHTEAAQAAHRWQQRVVNTLKEQLEESTKNNKKLLDLLIEAAYKNLSQSILVAKHYLPSLAEVRTEVYEALRPDRGQLMITKVNSEDDVMKQLDEQGQLKLRTPLNIFIGGQILDRGITVQNLIGFFYGRRPNRFQQDTVLQHSRMFGFRPLQDLTVTRFYTSPEIYDAMRRIQDSDSALRESIAKGDQEVIFIRKDDAGKVIPCSPNKILLSTTTTLKPFKRLLPVGFQTDYKTRVTPITKEIDEMLDDAADHNLGDKTFLIPWSLAKQIIKKIESTLTFEAGYSWDVSAFIACMQYLSKSDDAGTQAGSVWCLVRKDRKARRFLQSSPTEFYDAPDTSHIEGEIAKKVATQIPMLMLFRQNGAEVQGWMGAPFYWPVLYSPKNTKTAIFASDVVDED
ncbi:MAG TPA: Z1 domain-containing protein [Pyrinomonadaceae bacterium]|nr:Z1 domain-containing protein [Pyrinomonadaceae bacterium]